MGKSTVRVVNVEDVEWEEYEHGEHCSVRGRRLSGDMALGVGVMRLAPGSISCPFHYHLKEDEHFFVLRGSVTLRTDDGTTVLREGDAVSCPAGPGSAHQLYNHGHEPADLIAVGLNRPDEICHYPDSGKWLVRELKTVGRLEAADYWDGEPEPPLVKR